MSHSQNPPLPLPRYVELQLGVGMEALELLQEILACTSETSLDNPWIPAMLRRRVAGLCLKADSLDVG